MKVGSSSLTSLTAAWTRSGWTRWSTRWPPARGGQPGRAGVLGAIAAGLAPLGLARRPRDLATQQAAAASASCSSPRPTVRRSAGTGQAIGQVLLTADDMIRRAHYRNAQRTLERLLGLDVLPVVNENDTVATDEIRVGDNDRLAALVAHLIGRTGSCCSPTSTGSTTVTRGAGARLVARGRRAGRPGRGGGRRAGAGSLGTGGMATKITAAAMASAAGIPVLLAAAADVGAALDTAADGPKVGTAFRPSGRRMSARRFWLRHAADVRGRLDLDRGATTAVLDRRRSLLAAGIRGVSGDFVAGDVVDLVDPDGTVVARGWSGSTPRSCPS